MQKLLEELKVKIIETLNFEDITPDNIDEEDQLVGGELGIDSIDILELVMMIEKDYSVKIDNQELGAKVFANLKALAGYIYEKSPEI
ncbi:MAG: phosphopantetheine-binding protein [Thermodesulfobacteriota bacterium]|nr:phosphopantetheine-binding protein [Thermodesulfobacteriota bacterium]